ncbi:MAG: DoxX family protein [Leptolyngbyaceae cyanobacterium bins.59]|nr:DoxX family protein [Leptolyngbyaceae cyanobacterium bins.59]
MKGHSFRSSSLETQTEQYTSRTGLYATRNLLPLIARILLVAIFLWSGANKILHPEETQAYMAAFGMPLTWVFLPAAIALELLGGLSILLGIYPRLGAAALAFFTLITGFIFHSNFADPLEQIMFMKNLAMVGGLLLVVQYGVGNTVWRSRGR